VPHRSPGIAGTAGRSVPGSERLVTEEDDEEGGDIIDREDAVRTLDALRRSGDPEDVDRQPVLGSDDIPVRPGEWPLGYPLQGIPRVAAVLNLNYEFNETRQQWERQKKGVTERTFRPGGSGLFAGGTIRPNEGLQPRVGFDRRTQTPNTGGQPEVAVDVS